MQFRKEHSSSIFRQVQIAAGIAVSVTEMSRHTSYGQVTTISGEYQNKNKQVCI